MAEIVGGPTRPDDAKGRRDRGVVFVDGCQAKTVSDTAASRLEERLRCPISGSRLRRLTDEQCDALNERIAAGTLYDRTGRLIRQPLEAVLGDELGRWAYRIEHAIPQLLSGEALPLVEITYPVAPAEGACHASGERESDESKDDLQANH